MNRIQSIHILSNVRDSAAARLAAREFADIVSYADEEPRLPEDSDPKAHLIITANKGEFIKACPCTSRYTGCGYTVLNYMHGCPMTCTYCILQAYLNTPAIRLFANWDDLEQELDQKVWQASSPRRVGTGELGDSLALERMCGFGARLVELFGQQDKSVLELKTKTADISGLLTLPHREQTVLGWSVNAPAIIAGEEQDTASLEDRLKAARAAADAGYAIAFHLDPAIHFKGWQEAYAELFACLGDYIRPDDRVVWFSLGGMRFMPALKHIIDRKHPESIVAAGEFVEGLDGKKRYYKKVRIEIFDFLYAQAQKLCPQAAVYYCMESDAVWQHTAGFTPTTRAVKELLDSKVF